MGDVAVSHWRSENFDFGFMLPFSFVEAGPWVKKGSGRTLAEGTVSFDLTAGEVVQVGT